MEEHKSRVASELKEHLPFTVFSAFIAIIATGIFTIVVGEESLPGIGSNLFHIFHPLHIFASAATTTSMFWKYRKDPVRAVLVGVSGALFICLLSDIIFPYSGGVLLGIGMEMHICAIQHPMIIAPFLITGIMMGFMSPRLVEHSTIYSHSAHILLSTMASLVYMISFGMTDWLEHVGWVFVILVMVVLIPCCLSDIIFPLFFTRGKRSKGGDS